MKGFIDEHRGCYSVESMCKQLHMAPSTYYAHAALKRNPDLRSNRTKADNMLCEHIARIWYENYCVYGVRKVWHSLLNEQIKVARCTVERLMSRLCLEGVSRGKHVRTTFAASTPLAIGDKVKRAFSASKPNAVWVADFTYVSTWQGFAYVAFVIDLFARRIVGWKVSKHMRAQFVLDALEQALYQRRPKNTELIHHSDKGSQYTCISYTQRLIDAGIEPSVGKTGSAYDNALAETVNGLYKTELTKRKSWETLNQLEFATLEWVHWFNHQRILSSIGYIPPAKAEEIYYDQLCHEDKIAA